MEGLNTEHSQLLELKQIEIQSFLDLTLAINQNHPETGFFKILESYLLEKFGINHFSILSKEGDWKSTFVYGQLVQNGQQLYGSQHIRIPALVSEYSPEWHSQNSHVDLFFPILYQQELKGFVVFSKPKAYPEKFLHEIVSLLQTLANLTYMAIENQKLLIYRLEQEAMRKEIEIARQVQQMLFPKTLPNHHTLKVHITYLPHMDVSGDYYDFIPLDDNRYAICVADVSGKGMSAALLMANFQACLRTLMVEKKNLVQAVEVLNKVLCQNSNLERFITCFLAIYDADSRTLSYINSGHTPPGLVKENGEVILLTKGSTILGIFPDLPSLAVGEIVLQGDVLLAAYTDGLSEIENEEGEQFGSERVEEFLAENRTEKLPILHQRLLNRLSFFTSDQGFSDDITLLTVRMTN